MDIMKNLIQLSFTLLIFSSISCKMDNNETINSSDIKSQIQISISTMKDSRDGQIYNIVKIGDQWWMAENLNYYTPSGSWYYDNDSILYSKTYGRLYLWSTVMNGQDSSSSNPSGVQGISPTGWHIPSVAEWTVLENYLISFGLNGNALKDTTAWDSIKTGNNRAKFNAVPAGTVYNNGSSFVDIFDYASFLTSTIDKNTGGVWGRCLDYNSSIIRSAPLGLQNGCSVRCVKNN